MDFERHIVVLAVAWKQAGRGSRQEGQEQLQGNQALYSYPAAVVTAVQEYLS